MTTATRLPDLETPVTRNVPMPPPADFATAMALIATLREDVADLISQRNAAEETVRRYATQADLDRLTIREWERLGNDWTAQRRTLEVRIHTLEQRTASPRIHLHIHVQQGGIVNVHGGGA